MAQFTPSKKTIKDFNDGDEYLNRIDVVQADTVNNLVEGLLYYESLAEIAIALSSDVKKAQETADNVQLNIENLQIALSQNYFDKLQLQAYLQDNYLTQAQVQAYLDDVNIQLQALQGNSTNALEEAEAAKKLAEGALQAASVAAGIAGNAQSIAENAVLLQGGTSIPANADLNDYVTFGNYYCPSNDTAMTVRNIPAGVDGAFILKVFSGNGTGYPTQELIKLVTNQHYSRFLNGNMEWDVWAKITVSPDEFVRRDGGDWRGKQYGNQLYVLPDVPREVVGEAETKEYFQALIKWLCQNYPNCVHAKWTGVATPNSTYQASIHIYNTNTVNDEGYPQYADAMATNLEGGLILFGFANYSYYFKSIYDEFVNKQGDTMTGSLTVQGVIREGANRVLTNANTAFTGDVNTLTTAGQYGVSGSAHNIPIQQSGILYVATWDSGTYAQQTYITNPDVGDIIIYHRGTLNAANTSWGSWVQVPRFTNNGLVAPFFSVKFDNSDYPRADFHTDYIIFTPSSSHTYIYSFPLKGGTFAMTSDLASVYQVGDYVNTENTTSPASTVGGTWEDVSKEGETIRTWRKVAE